MQGFLEFYPEILWQSGQCIIIDFVIGLKSGDLNKNKIDEVISINNLNNEIKKCIFQTGRYIFCCF